MDQTLPGRTCVHYIQNANVTLISAVGSEHQNLDAGISQIVITEVCDEKLAY